MNQIIEDKKLINRNPSKRFGKPCIRHTRISVQDVMGWLAAGMTNDEIIYDFPELTRADIKACQAYVADKGNKF